jgi:hypothetical protein
MGFILRTFMALGGVAGFLFVSILLHRSGQGIRLHHSPNLDEYPPREII